MRLRLISCGVCVLLFMCVFMPRQALALDTPPQDAITHFLETIRQMKFPPQNAETQAQLVKEANSMLDLKAMSVKALKEHWQEATPSQREKFLNRMWQLVEAVAYPHSVEFLGDMKIEFPEVSVHDQTAEVHSVVVHDTAALNAPVVYRLRVEGDKWVIEDVLLDGVSISEDLNYQFDKIIQDSSFDGLLEKMNERLERARKENQPKAAEPST